MADLWSNPGPSGANEVWNLEGSLQNRARAWLRDSIGAAFVLRIVGIALIYFIAARLGLELAFVHESATAVWPPTGIAIASLLLLGWRHWPGVFLGAFVANAVTDVGFAVAGGIAVGNTLEALAAVWMTRRFAGGVRVFDRVWTIVLFVLLIAPIAASLSATFGVASLVSGGAAQWSRAGAIWFTWWLGDLTAAMMIAPVIVLWAKWPVPPVLVNRIIELILAVAVAIGISLLIFGGMLPAGSQHAPLSFLILPPLVWSAFRFGRRGAVTVACAIAAIAIAGTLRGQGPFYDGDPNESLLMLQAFTATVTVTSLIVAALEGQKLTMQSALHLQEDRLGYALAAGRMGIWEWELASGRVTWSDGLEAIHGLKAGTFGGTFEDFQRDLHPEDRPIVLEAIRRTLRTHFDYGVVYRIVPSDGVVRWVEASGKVIRDLNGEPIRMTGVCADITQRKLAELQALEIQRQLNDLFENGTIGMHWVNPQGIILRANNAELTLLGYREDEFVGHFIGEFHVDQRLINDMLKRLGRGEVICDCESRMRCKDGSIKHVLIDSSAYSEAGRFVHSRCFTRDITQRKLAEEAIRQSEARHRALIEASSDAIWTWKQSDVDHEDEMVHRLEQITGLDLKSLTDSDWMSIIVPEDRERVRIAWEEAMNRGVAYEQEYGIRDRFGTQRQVVVRAVPVKADDGSVAEWCGTIGDVTERQIAKRALEHERELLQTIIDRIPVMITLYEPETKHLRLNREFQRVVGWSNQDAAEQSLLEHCYPDPELRKQVQIFMQSCGDRWMDIPMRTRDDRVVEASWANIRLSDGTQVGIGIDISNRKDAERELMELAEDRRNHVEELTTLLDVMPAGVFIAHDPECRVITANKAGAQMLGLPDVNFNASKTGVAADRLQYRVFQNDKEVANEDLVMQRCARLGVPIMGEQVDIVLDEGTVTHVYQFASPLRTPEGRVRGCIGVSIDVTSLKRADRAIRATERLAKQRFEELSSIYQNVPIGLSFLDPDLRIIKINQQMAAIAGHTVDELVGRCLDEFLLPQSELPQILRRAIQTGEPVINREQISAAPADPNVQRVWLQNFLPVKDAHGQVLGVNCVVQDITERKQVELELREHREQLEELVISRTAELERSHQQLRSAERILAMGTLAAGLGHDIGNLLLPIRSRLDAMESMDLGPEANRHMAAITTCLIHLQTMVRGLRLFSQNPENRNENSAATVVCDWIKEADPFFRGVLPSNVRMEYDIADDLPAIDIAPHALSQSVLNLITNSRDAIGTKRGGRILIRACSVSGGEMVRLEIRDNGEGMTPTVRARAIEPFFTTRTRSLSTGLGLSVVHGVICGAGGHLEIHSPPPDDLNNWRCGTSVVLNIPVNRRHARLDDDRASTVTVSISDPRTGSLLQTMLTSMGFTVQPSVNGVAADSGIWITEHAEGRVHAAREFLNGRTDRTVILVGDAPPEWSELSIKVIDRSCMPSAIKAALA